MKLSSIEARAMTTPERAQSDEEDRYQKWLELLNYVVEIHTGVSLDDLPDFCTRDGFDSGTTPMEFYQENIAPEIGMD